MHALDRTNQPLACHQSVPRNFKGERRASTSQHRYVGVKKSVIRFGPASKGATGDPIRSLQSAQEIAFS